MDIDGPIGSTVNVMDVVAVLPAMSVACAVTV